MPLRRSADSSPVDRQDRRDAWFQSLTTRATRSALAVNLKIARAFGIIISQSILLRADEVIR